MKFTSYFSIKNNFNMIIYRKHLSQPWFREIFNGNKIFEGRLNKNDFSNMNIGDNIIFYNENNEFSVEIISIDNYKYFNDYLIDKTIEKCLPCDYIHSIEDGVNEYYKFYKKEDEEKYGVICIGMKII